MRSPSALLNTQWSSGCSTRFNMHCAALPSSPKISVWRCEHSIFKGARVRPFAVDHEADGFDLGWRTGKTVDDGASETTTRYLYEDNRRGPGRVS